MPLIDSLHPSKNVFLPNSEEMVTMVLVPQHQVFALNKEVKKYLEEYGLADDPVAKKQVYEAATLIRSIRKHGTVNLVSEERGESVFHSIESFLQRFADDQADWLMAHHEILKRESLPPISDLDDTAVEQLYEQIDAGKDVSPSLKDFGYATLLSFTLSLASRLAQLKEESRTTSSPTGFSLSSKMREAAKRLATRRAEGSDATVDG